jgi:hypothetical protein
MKKFFLALLFMPVFAGAQKIPSPAKFAKTITAEDLKTQLYIVAGADMQGRETATEGQHKAAAYIESQFKSLGLLPGNNGSYQQHYPVFQDSLINAAITVNGQNFETEKDFVVNTSSNYTATLMGGEVVFVGYGLMDSTRNDYKDIDANGKIVLILAGTPPSAKAPTRRSRFNNAIQEAAMQNGAVAVLIVQEGFPRRAMNSRGNMTMNGYKKTIYPNTFYISEQVAEKIMGADFAAAKDAMKSGNPVAKSYNADVKLAFEKFTKELQSSNVIGYVEGTDLKDEYVFMTAHYDHLGMRGDSVIYYGADDDGSGTVSVLEFAEAFTKAKAAGKGPRRSVVFMTVSGEEKGLWGSAYYGEHPIFPLEKTTVDLNIDMIGRSDSSRKQGDSTNYVYVVGDDKLSSDLKPISEAVNKKYTKMELDYKFNDPKDPNRIYFRSDHYNFARKGVPIIFYYDGMLGADYHKPTDTPDKINYALMEKRARLIFNTAWEMANRNEMLKRDIPLEKAF